MLELDSVGVVSILELFELVKSSDLFVTLLPVVEPLCEFALLIVVFASLGCPHDEASQIHDADSLRFR